MVTPIMVILLIAALLALTYDIQPVKASEKMPDVYDETYVWLVLMFVVIILVIALALWEMLGGRYPSSIRPGRRRPERASKNLLLSFAKGLVNTTNEFVSRFF